MRLLPSANIVREEGSEHELDRLFTCLTLSLLHVFVLEEKSVGEPDQLGRRIFI